MLRTDTDFELTRRFATAGELAVGFANSFVWQFAGTNSESALSILNFTLAQPLLRGAGRAVGCLVHAAGQSDGGAWVGEGVGAVDEDAQ